MIRRPPRSTLDRSSAASDVYKRQTWFLVATSGYLKRRRRPQAPGDLADHDCLLFGAGSTTVNLRLQRGEQSAQVAIAAHLLVSDFDVLHAAASAGLGIALLPAYRCIEDLRIHRLERVLRDWNLSLIHISEPTR